MHIGIIGTGAVGAALTHKLVAAGHQVKVTNSQSPEELAQKARELGATPVTLQEVVQNVDVVFLSIPLLAIPKLPAGLFRELPAEVVVADTSNYSPMRDGQIAALDNGQAEGLWVAEQLGRPIVKAFSNQPAQTLAEGGTAPGTPGRLAIAIVGADDQAKKVVATLINDTGFDVVDAGSLADSWRMQGGTPAFCTDLTAPELTQALAAAVPGKGPGVLAQVIAQLMQLTSAPTREEFVALNRRLSAAAVS